MSRKLVRLRTTAFEQQSGRCYYCQLPMWQSTPQHYAAKYGITLKQTHSFKCTAEHLIAAQDGGPTTGSNIAAACLLCNQRRHRRKAPPTPCVYKSLVAKRLSKHLWHAPWVFQKFFDDGQVTQHI